MTPPILKEWLRAVTPDARKHTARFDGAAWVTKDHRVLEHVVSWEPIFIPPRDPAMAADAAMGDV